MTTRRLPVSVTRIRQREDANDAKKAGDGISSQVFIRVAGFNRVTFARVLFYIHTYKLKTLFEANSK